MKPATSPSVGSIGATDRSGFTIVEMVLALVLLGAIITAALNVLASQNEAFIRGVDRMTVIQNLRYSFQVLEVEVKTLGTSLVDGQAAIVYVDDDVIAFSADYVTNVADDISAVYYEPNAPTGQVTAPQYAVTIPNSSFSWPDTTFQGQGGQNAPAELLIFFFDEDTETARADDYVLYRQVNNGTPEVVARHLLKDNGAPFFTYYRERNPTSGIADIVALTSGDLPLAHTATLHLSSADTASAALIDSIRAVEVKLGSTNDEPGTYERQAFLARIIGMPNAGQQKLKTCGDAPFAVTALAAVVQSNAETGDPEVLLSWAPSIDEPSGEKDVIRYVLWRRPVGGAWGDPYLSIPAGLGAYTYVDATVEPGESWEYSIASQDCTPTTSDITFATPVIIP